MYKNDHTFKVYLACTPGWAAESVVSSYKLLRSCLLTASYFYAGGVPTDHIQESYIKTTLARTDINYLPDHNASISTDRDYGPILVDIENWYPYDGYVADEAEALEKIEQYKRVHQLVRDAFPNRRIATYGLCPWEVWNPHKNWWTVQNNAADGNYASYKSTHLWWIRQSKRTLRGGTAGSLNHRGALTYTDFNAPVCYLPNGTTFNGTQDYRTHADTKIFERVFRTNTEFCKRYWQKPCLPFIQFYSPPTNTYCGATWAKHQLDIALADPNCDGVLIYQPSSGNWSSWRDDIADWVTDNLE